MKLINLAALLLIAGTLLAQGNNPNAYNALSARVQAINHGIPNEELDDVSFTYAVEFALRRQFGKYFGVSVPLQIGVIDIGEFENPVIIGADLLAKVFPFGSEGKISPYLHGGVGGMTESFERSNRQYPLGAGFNFLLGENSWLGIQGEYRLSDTDLRDNVRVGIGYTYRLSSLDDDRDGVTNKEDECPSIFGLASLNGCPDTDGDGIADKDDACPQVAGSASLNGCPDADDDGITDAADACPDEAGPAVTGGCPDRDGDQVPDKDDKCPDVAGTVTLSGCPDADGDEVTDAEDNCPDLPGDPAHGGCPDSDGDGVYDDVDKCPQRAAKTADGCPAPAPVIQPAPAPPPLKVVTEEVKERLNFAAEAVEFETGSAQLKRKSYAILAEISGIMKQYPGYNLTISGHTDNVGSEANNQRLSERRAEACKAFLLAAGVQDRRITYAGFGESRPRDTNVTALGRKRNRRVEFELKPGR